MREEGRSINGWLNASPRKRWVRKGGQRNGRLKTEYSPRDLILRRLREGGRDLRGCLNVSAKVKYLSEGGREGIG